MAKIYLSPAAHAHDNPCSYDKKCGENIHCNLYLDELEPFLKACGIQYKRASRNSTGSSHISKVIAESNAYKPDIHYVCHTNAFNGTVKGSRPHVWLKSGNGKKWAEIILKHRKKIYPYPCSIKDGSAWAEVKNTVSVAIYEELVFHDNKEDCKWFHENMRKMAEYTARAFCEIFGIKFVDPYAKPPEPKPEPKPDTLYRVQVGAFKSKANAERLANDLKSKGYAAFITT